MALIKEAAKVKNDEKLLIQIRDVDLIAKELQMHRICYIDYTRIVTLKNKPSDADETEFHGSQSPVYLLTFSQPALRHE